MPFKDPEKRKQYQKKRYWKKRSQIIERVKKWRNQPDIKERRNELERIRYAKNKDVDKRWLKSTKYYDFETHRQLAIHSGIKTVSEWFECYRLGFFPIGIYCSPEQMFQSKK